MRRNRGFPIVAVLVFAILATGALAFAIARSQRLPDGPQPIAWDREACAHCHMHVSERGFAAQLQTTDGRVLDFDDPGCLLSYLGAEHPAVHATWFHHLREDRWIPREKASFVPVTPTPMGYGLGAVDGAEKDAIGFDAALAQVSKGARP